MKEGEVEGACIIHGRYEKILQNFRRKTLKGRDHLEDMSVDWRIVLKWILMVV
jgi:hypothetical protein